MSFLFSTLGFTCVSFCTGALAWWGPKYIQDAILSLEVEPEDRPMGIDRQVTFIKQKYFATQKEQSNLLNLW